jgi:hypothetical protein
MPRPLLPVLAGLFIGVAFLASNVAALHDPRPHDVPVAVSGAPAARLQTALDQRVPGGYDVSEVPDVGHAVRRREAYGGLDARRGVVIVAGANGYQATTAIAQALSSSAADLGFKQAGVVDAVPLQPGDPNGLSLQQIVLGTIIGGFMMGVLTAQLALGEALWRRIAAYLGFGLAFGLLGALVLDPLLGVLTGHFFAVWACIGVTALAISTSVGALARMLGQAALPIASLVFLIIGNPSAGASAPTEFLPGFYRAVGPWLPPNADASALLGSTYFDAPLVRPLLVLAAWIVVPGTILIALDRRRGARPALAHDASRAATPAPRPAPSGR